jgi:hypothetical protein
MGDSWIKQLLEADDPERIKKLVKKSDGDSKTAVLAAIGFAEQELLKLNGLVKTDADALSEDNIVSFRKALIAIQLFARQMIGADTLAANLERVVLNLLLPMIDLCGPLTSQGAVTLKIDAISMYAKLLQAFEDMMTPFSAGILDFIVAQLDQHALHFSGKSGLDPFEAMVLRELYSELISQSVDVCCSMHLVAPEKLSEKAKALFERSAAALKIVTDINCKYELIELLARVCLLGLKSGEEQTAEEDFLDFEMRRLQMEDTELQERKKSSTTAQASLTKMSSPLWKIEGLSFQVLFDTLQTTIELFDKEEYNNDDLEDGEGEESEEDEEGDEMEMSAPRGAKPRQVAGSSAQKSRTSPSPNVQASSSTEPAFEVVEKQPSSSAAKRDASNDEGATEKRDQDESGSATVIALLVSLSAKCFSPAEHSACFDLAYASLMKKILSAFSSSETYGRLPAMLDPLAQLVQTSESSLVELCYDALVSQLEEMMKTMRVWRSEDPSPARRRVYDYVRGELLQTYSALLKACPVATVKQSDHFLKVSNLFADPMLLAEFGVAVAKGAQIMQNGARLEEGGLLFTIVDSYLKELSNSEASTSMKKVVIQSMGKLAIGAGKAFSKMLPVVVPLFLFLGRQNPDLAPATITSLAQILTGVVDALDTQKEPIMEHVQQCIDQAIAMVIQDIIMSGFEISSSLKTAIGKASEISFQFATKQANKSVSEEGEEDEEDGEDEFMQDDNLADVVYKGECFLAYLLHLTPIAHSLPKTTIEAIFLTLLELHQKPTLFEEDSMLKMTAVDILIFLVESIPLTHTKSHRERAIQSFKEADIEEFEEEVEVAIKRLQDLKF